jgi:hypothetical protein
MNAITKFPILIAGRQHLAELQLPHIGEVLSLWMTPRLLTASRTAILRPAEIRRFIVRVDGQPPSADLARAIAADADAFAAYRVARDTALAQATEGGMVYAECPHCRSWEADLIPLTLAVGLHVPFWPVVVATGDLALPVLAGGCDRPLSGEAATSRITFALPRVGINGPRGVLAGANAVARLADWKIQADRLFRESPDQAEDWEAESPGWHALLRFGAIIAVWPEPCDVRSLHALARVSLADFLFVDNIYYLTHCVAQPADTPMIMTCPNCHGRFQPLAPAPDLRFAV